MINFLKGKVFPKSISKKEASDTGMAMTLICLLLGYFIKIVIFQAMTLPKAIAGDPLSCIESLLPLP